MGRCVQGEEVVFDLKDYRMDASEEEEEGEEEEEEEEEDRDCCTTITGPAECVHENWD